jgi:hypothetical protein
MLKEIRDTFRIYLIIFLCLLLIAFVIAGIRYGLTIGQALIYLIDGKEHPLLGAFIFGTIGLIVGHFFIVIFFGMIATILNIDENLEKITKITMDLTKDKGLPTVSKTTENEPPRPEGEIKPQEINNDLNDDLDDGLEDLNFSHQQKETKNEQDQKIYNGYGNFYHCNPGSS